MHETARNSSFGPFFDDPIVSLTKPADKERSFFSRTLTDAQT